MTANSAVAIRGHAPTPRPPDAAKREPLAVLRNYPTVEPRAIGDVLGVRWGRMQGWEKVAQSATQPPLIFGVGLTLTGSIVDLDPALPGIIGGLREPPDGALTYVRRYQGGVGEWVASTGVGYTWGIGLDENPLGSGNIDLQPATATVIGGVTVQARSLAQGLALDGAGDLSAPLATDLLAGSIVEPPPDDLLYVRSRTAAGVSAWVPQAAGADFGTGLTLDDTVAPPIVHLAPAGAFPQFLGGVYAPIRDGTTTGLEVSPAGFDGRLMAPPASDLLLGTIVEPPADGIAHTRRFDVPSSRWVWEPALTAGLTITGIIPDVALIGPGELDVTVHVIGTQFTVTTEILVDGVPAPTTFVSATELTTLAQPSTIPAPKTVVVTVRDGATPGAGAEGFAYVATEAGLYQGRWSVAANAPDIGALAKENEWTWLATTIDPLVPEIAPAGLLGIAGLTIGNGDHIVWDATAALFVLIREPHVVYGIGLNLDETNVPPIVHLQPPNVAQWADPTQIGGVNVPPRDATQGLAAEGVGLIRAPLATDLLAGSIVEPPPDDKQYVRKRDILGVSTWVETVPTKPAGNVVAEIGVVYIPDDRGLDIGPDGSLTLLPASDNRLGGLFEPPALPVDKTYLRKFGQWVESLAVKPAGETVDKIGVVFVPPDRGLALNVEGSLALKPASENEIGGIREPAFGQGTWVRHGEGRWVPAPLPADPVTPAGNTAAEIGVVYIPDDRGLDIGDDGSLTLLPASDNRLGGLFDAPALPADKTYLRKFGQWVENTAVPVEPATATKLGVVKVPTDRGLTVALDGSLALSPASETEIGGLREVPALPAGKGYVRQYGQWVESLASKAIVCSDTPPASPTDDMMWFDTTTSNLFVRYNDGTSTQWVQINVEEAPVDGAPYIRQDATWVPSTAAAATIGDVKSGFQSADHAGWIKMDGRAVTTLTTTQQANAGALGFTTNLPDATDAVPMQRAGALGLVAGSWAILQANLPAINIGNSAVLTTSEAAATTATSSKAGKHTHAVTYYRSNGGGLQTAPGKATDMDQSSVVDTPEAGEHDHTMTVPAHTHTVPAHGHPLGGSNTPLVPKHFVANHFVYLGA